MQISCKDVSLGYGNTVVVDNLSFTVNKGDYLCIIGENGAGKTTLMKSILGALKPLSGTIARSAELDGSTIGYLTQSSESQKDFPASVREVVMSGFQKKCGLRPFYNRAERTEASAIMQRMGIDNLGSKSFSQLSGGQRQRVLLSRALCATSQILFLDEPVGGLDVSASSEMYQVIQQLNRQDNITILMITHDIECAIQYATHILKLGNQNFFGTVQQYAERLEMQGDKVRGCTCL